jgi:hypothetical protein
MITPEQFLMITETKSQPPPYKLGTIPADYVSGKPTVQFDGESSPSIKTYPYLSSYTPSANDRVLVAMVGHGGVIIGKIINA